MKCEIVRDLLPLYIEGLCSTESKLEIEHHMENCPACQDEYMQLQQEYRMPRVDSQQTEDFLKEKDLLEKSKEVIVHSFADKLIKRIFTVLMSISLIINMIMLVITILVYHYSYPKFYFKELGMAQVYILIFPFLPTVMAYLGRTAMIKLPKFKMLSRILLIGMIPAVVFGAVGTVSFVTIPPIGSITNNSDNYLELDGDLKQFEHVIQVFCPDKIPEDAKQINYHYERYSTLFSDNAILEASWVLKPEEYEAVKEQVLESSLFKGKEISESGGTGTIISIVYPENVTINFEYSDTNNRLTYRAHTNKNR